MTRLLWQRAGEGVLGYEVVRWWWRQPGFSCCCLTPPHNTPENAGKSPFINVWSSAMVQGTAGLRKVSGPEISSSVFRFVMRLDNVRPDRKYYILTWIMKVKLPSIRLQKPSEKMKICKLKKMPSTPDPTWKCLIYEHRDAFIKQRFTCRHHGKKYTLVQSTYSLLGINKDTLLPHRAPPAVPCAHTRTHTYTHPLLRNINK